MGPRRHGLAAPVCCASCACSCCRLGLRTCSLCLRPYCVLALPVAVAAAHAHANHVTHGLCLTWRLPSECSHCLMCLQGLVCSNWLAREGSKAGRRRSTTLRAHARRARARGLARMGWTRTTSKQRLKRGSKEASCMLPLRAPPHAATARQTVWKARRAAVRRRALTRQAVRQWARRQANARARAGRRLPSATTDK